MKHLKCDLSPMEKEIMNHLNTLKSVKELEHFKNYIVSIVENYIKMIDMKISSQDFKIDRSITYIEENITEAVTPIINEAINNLELIYDPTTESLTIGGVNNE